MSLYFLYGRTKNSLKIATYIQSILFCSVRKMLEKRKPSQFSYCVIHLQVSVSSSVNKSYTKRWQNGGKRDPLLKTIIKQTTMLREIGPEIFLSYQHSDSYQQLLKIIKELQIIVSRAPDLPFTSILCRDSPLRNTFSPISINSTPPMKTRNFTSNQWNC